MIIKEISIRTNENDDETSLCDKLRLRFKKKSFYLLEAKDELGNTGWGESVAFQSPWYTEETLQTNLHMIQDFLIPLRIRSRNRASR